jgi:hypothetical protein
MQFVAPILLVMATVVTVHGLLRTFFGPRADNTYPEAASMGSTVAFLYIVTSDMPAWTTFIVLTLAGIVTQYLSVKMHRRLSAPTTPTPKR